MDGIEILAIELVAIVAGAIVFAIFHEDVSFWVSQLISHFLIWFGGFILVDGDDLF